MRYSDSNVIYIEEVKKSLRKKRKLAQKKQQKLGNNSLFNENCKTNINIKVNIFETYTEFQQDKEHLLSNLETKRPKFKFPTILSQYRRTINPISSIYEATQKAIMNGDDGDFVDQWVLELIKDKNFINDVIDSLITDINRINNIIWLYKDYNFLFEELQKLFNILKTYSHYVKVFKTINSVY